ncbi:MAG: serine hydrolase, partial [Pseudomonadales bacterium]|nr:serine hydrolase [Pseudomonadales bacterium]
IDSGRGDEAIQRLIASSVLVPSLFEPGEMMSYCNLGYAVLGRILEVIRRQSYDQILQQYLFEPLGITHAFSRPEDALRFSCAVGHVQSTRNPEKWYVTRTPYLAFGQKAAGSTPSMSASDLLRFVQMHLGNGKNSDGDSIVKYASVKAMQKRQIKLLANSPNAIRAWGLGWLLMNWQGEKLYGHDGATSGQFAFLRVLPAKNLAVALLTNGGDAKGLYKAMFKEIFSALAKTIEPDLPAPAIKQPKSDSYVGIYENMQSHISVSIKKGRLLIDMVNKDSQQSMYPDNTTLAFIDKNTAQLISGNPVLDRSTVHFSARNAHDNPQYLQTGLRQYQRK